MAFVARAQAAQAGRAAQPQIKQQQQQQQPRPASARTPLATGHLQTTPHLPNISPLRIVHLKKPSHLQASEAPSAGPKRTAARVNTPKQTQAHTPTQKMHSPTSKHAQRAAAEAEAEAQLREFEEAQEALRNAHK